MNKYKFIKLLNPDTGIVKDDLKTDLLELIPLTFGNKLAVSKFSLSQSMDFKIKFLITFNSVKCLFPFHPKIRELLSLWIGMQCIISLKMSFEYFFQFFGIFLTEKRVFTAEIPLNSRPYNSVNFVFKRIKIYFWFRS